MKAAVVIAFIAAHLVLGSAAVAHARLDRSIPASGAVLDRAPESVVLQFNSDVERRFARFTLRLPDGSKRALTGPTGNGMTRELTIPVGTLPAGEYQLEWSVVSRDGHRISGTLRFTVKGA